SYLLLVISRLLSPVFPYTTLFRSVLMAWCESFITTRPLGMQEPSSAASRKLPAHTWSSAMLIHFFHNRVGSPVTWNSESNDLRRSEEHTSELHSPDHIVCRLLLEK